MAHPEVQVGLGGPPGGLRGVGRPSQLRRGVGSPCRRAGRCQESFPDVQEGSEALP